MDRIICVVGPTASGKTALAVALAQALNGEVISCDSMQLYRQMDIGTAKPTAEEMKGIPHHMIDILDPAEDYSVGRYVEDADSVLQNVLARGKTAVVAGGTGLYVDSLMLGRSFAAAPSTGKREELQALARRDGIEAVLELLRSFDPERAEKLHIGDEKRIIRAAEIYLETGKTATQHDAESKLLPPKYRPLWIGLNYVNRQALYDRIDRRVLTMLELGLEAEVNRLLDSGVPENATALQAIGYKEFLGLRRGEATREEVIAQLQQNSRRYAKRQLSWFRRNPDIHWIMLPDEPEISEICREALKLAEEAGISI